MRRWVLACWVDACAVVACAVVLRGLVAAAVLVIGRQYDVQVVQAAKQSSRQAGDEMHELVQVR